MSESDRNSLSIIKKTGEAGNQRDNERREMGGEEGEEGALTICAGAGGSVIVPERGGGSLSVTS